MPASHFQYGKPTAGSIHKIHVDGLSGIADTIWVVEQPTTSDKLKDGSLCDDIWCKLKIIVELEIFFADQDKDKRYCIGPMTRERCDLGSNPRRFIMFSKNGEDCCARTGRVGQAHTDLFVPSTIHIDLSYH